MTTSINKSMFLRTSRSFPEELDRLTVECNKSYVEIASAVNNRVIGIFPVNKPAITGNSYYLTSSRQQTLRQIFSITSYTNFNHGISTTSIPFFPVIKGSGFNGVNYFPIPFVNGSDTTGQVEVFVNSTQVVFVAGVNAPTITSGIIELEWMSPV